MSYLINRIIHKKITFAIVVRKKNQFRKKGVIFVTKKHEYLQLGFLKHKKNHIIIPHQHKKKIRKIPISTEVLIIRSGEIKAIFYDFNNKTINKDTFLKRGDIIILLQGGHGFQVLKNAEIIEIKQGPYVNIKNDKKMIQ